MEIRGILAAAKQAGFSRGPASFPKNPSLEGMATELQSSLDFQRFTSDIVPSSDGAYNLGSSEKNLNGIYAKKAHITGTATFNAGVVSFDRGSVADFATNSSLVVIPTYTAGNSPWDLWHPASGFLRDGAIWLQKGSPASFRMRVGGVSRIVGIWDTATCTYAGTMLWERDCANVVRLSSMQHSDAPSLKLIHTGTATFGPVIFSGTVTFIEPTSGISHLDLSNIGTYTHSEIDDHIDNAATHFTMGEIDHLNISNVGTYTHSEIDSHIDNVAIHFLESDISHGNILDVGTHTHGEIDTHIDDETVHFATGSISHFDIGDIGFYGHTDIDTHINDSEIHFGLGTDSVTAAAGDHVHDGYQAAIQWQDEGGGEGSPGDYTVVNFTGAGVTASGTTTVLTVNIPGGAGEAFPVGSVFIAVVDTNPATLLGYGTWTAFGAGRVLIGINSGDADFDTAEETGGSKTVASSGTVGNESSHTHLVTSNVSVSDHTSHTHTVTTNVAVGNHDVLAHSKITGTKHWDETGADSSYDGHTISAHSVTNNTVNSGAPSSTLTHVVTNDEVTSDTGSEHTHSYTGNSTSVVQPYIVVYMWKRTA